MMNGLPQKQGLYDPRFEKDACGIGLVCNINGRKSHLVIKDAIEVLKNMTHRGGLGSEIDTGDGAGILIQISHTFFKKVCANESIQLPDEGKYGVGMFFCSPDLATRQKSIAKLHGIIESEGLSALGLRNVPVHADCIGKTAREALPHIGQIFIGYGNENDETDTEQFERKLFVALKRAEKEIRECRDHDPYFYFSSLSSKTIVYKGMLTPEQVIQFYLDLKDIDMKSAIALVHSRFSTNTFPSWERAHPNRYIIHNGEINTIRGNVNWARARQSSLHSEQFDDLKKVFPIINENGSDSAMLDNFIHMLVMSGIPLAQAVMMAIPEPWEADSDMPADIRAFYEFNSCLLEAWDGPAAIGFSDGRFAGATLDRNGLRPARYYVTTGGRLILSSEAGVLQIPPEEIVKKGLLRPGELLLVDTRAGRMIENAEIKSEIASQRPYQKWLDGNLLELENIQYADTHTRQIGLDTMKKQRVFGYTYEDTNLVLRGIIEQGHDPVTAMGTDIPLAVLSEKPQLLYNYFKQLFAQVTNPPIDTIREKIVVSTYTLLGSESDLLNPTEANCRRIRLKTPVLTDSQMHRIKNIADKNFKTAIIPMLFDTEDENGLEKGVQRLFVLADEAVRGGCNILILSDRGASFRYAPIPALLASAGLHHHLIRTENRMKTSIVVESGEPREVHHFATLIGYGANAVNPYLALESLQEMEFSDEALGERCEEIYINAVTEGIVKIMSKMGISTMQSYQGAQIFEALGIDETVVDEYFTETVTRIGGITMEDIEREALLRHKKAFLDEKQAALETQGEYKWRRDGEYHLYNPETIYLLQRACRTGDYELYKEFAEKINGENERLCNIRGLLQIRTVDKPVALEKIESVEEIVKRFKTGAMSYGSISPEAHECMAIAMNRLGGKSNSGEGGEMPERFKKNGNGDSRCSAIKQVASGRFGVSIHYLQNAVEIQIKMAQGAKPGEGGHLPGGKVYPWIAKARSSTPGVELISPPPHHDIYSIEDLAQLIHDLKNANPCARISVKLVSEAGVGTVAVGVAKGLADVILISGYDGGTGAAPRSSIRHTGLPWELGLAEAHQALLMNHMRNRVVLEADGKLLTGRDVAVAALLGAEEFGFATAPLVAMGCVMMRVCNLDTCPVGIATQNPELRKKFMGKPEHVENFMRFVAMDLREWMAKIGVRTINELVGHVERLTPKRGLKNWKAQRVNLTGLLYQPEISGDEKSRYFNVPQNHGIERGMDMNTLLEVCRPAIETGKSVIYKLEINNTNRTVGTALSGVIAGKYGVEGLPDNTISIDFVGSAGQSFGAFLSRGITLRISGDCNDYAGKGLSGGRIIAMPSEKAMFTAAENIIVGNVALYGAIAGEAYFNGLAGERFAVRNSGATAVVEGIGNHGCEYMTGGTVVVIGKTGRNFGAGMSGGRAFIYDDDGTFARKCDNPLLEVKSCDEEGFAVVQRLVQAHFDNTGSHRAKLLLNNWNEAKLKFVCVIPLKYKRITGLIAQYKAEGLSEETAIQQAFDDINGNAGARKAAEGREKVNG